MGQDKIENMDRIIQSWLNSSDENYHTTLDLYHAKRLSWALFPGHLSIEKLLMAYFVKVNLEHAPLLHNLSRLAELSYINLTDQQRIDFSTITTFNLNARYDDYKKSFSKKCTLEYADFWIIKIKYNHQWIVPVTVWTKPDMAKDTILMRSGEVIKKLLLPA